jgi:hypothetical protein
MTRQWRPTSGVDRAGVPRIERCSRMISDWRDAITRLRFHQVRLTPVSLLGEGVIWMALESTLDHV